MSMNTDFSIFDHTKTSVHEIFRQYCILNKQSQVLIQMILQIEKLVKRKHRERERVKIDGKV